MSITPEDVVILLLFLGPFGQSLHSCSLAGYPNHPPMLLTPCYYMILLFLIRLGFSKVLPSLVLRFIYLCSYFFVIMGVE
jgi:hypothetical protein